MCLPTATNDHLSIFIRNDCFVGVCVCVSNCNQRNERHNELWRASEMWTTVSGHMWILIISIDEARLPFAVNSITKANSHTHRQTDTFNHHLLESIIFDVALRVMLTIYQWHNLCVTFFVVISLIIFNSMFDLSRKISYRLNPCESVWDRMRRMEIFVWYA